MKKEIVIPIDKVNRNALLMIIPLALFTGIPYTIIHGFTEVSLKIITINNLVSGVILTLLIFIAGAIVHELLHGITWAVFAGWKSISFGIKWEYLTPYCHCSKALKKKYFVAGAVMPLLVLGIFPLVYSYIDGNFKIWFFGYFFTMAAFGDINALWALRKYPGNTIIEDHPTELGFFVKTE
ncbi:MAG: DUF3267 domain-containing protein [Bacteroidales bacterium]|nr:DUF3267 domain-containing protein [Bacteroidales bacterium]MBN2817785.1 DUF3267 domain-containing protein [Bacteroidales bacterium]